MTLRDHIIYGGVAGAVLYPVYGLTMSIAFWVASFLIDLDHYIDYVYHNGFRDFSIRRMFHYHRVLVKFWFSPSFLNLEIFHTVEFLAALYVAAELTGLVVLKAVFWGFIFHNVLDIVFLARHGILTRRAYSFTEYYLRKRRMMAAGLDPGRLCDHAAGEAIEGGGGLYTVQGEGK